MLKIICFVTLVCLAYTCGFSKLKRPLLQHMKAKVNLPTSVTKPQKKIYENMRIYADYTNLDSIDPAQKDYIQNHIMPSAISYYQTTLKIKRLPENLQTGALCGDYFSPSYLMDPGVNADLVILVIAENLPEDEYVAAAMPCELSLIDDRPIYGYMVFNLAYLPMKKVVDHQENLSTALHELAHVLGFNDDLYEYFRNPDTGELLSDIIGAEKITGGFMIYLDVEPLTSRLRSYFGCDSLKGAYLEDEGESGSAGAHFERRVFMNEYMTASSITEPVISEFTLALFEGSGWYKPNYNMTEPFNWGRGAGCQFLDGPCIDSQGIPYYYEFCDVTFPIGCSFTARRRGYCSSGAEGDIFANNCPYYDGVVETDCEDPTNQVHAIFSAEKYGKSSRCFTGTIIESDFQPAYGAFCFPTSCDKSENGFVLKLTVGKNIVTCSRAGPIYIDGYNGELDCPSPNDFCVRANPTYCEKGCSGRGSCVNNKCKCPAGWGGVDCADPVFASCKYYERGACLIEE